MISISSIIFLNLSPYFVYIGPGMGGGIIAAIFGIIAAFFFGLWGIIYYPLKRALKNRKNRRNIKNNKNNKNNVN